MGTAPPLRPLFSWPLSRQGSGSHYAVEELGYTKGPALPFGRATVRWNSETFTLQFYCFVWDASFGPSAVLPVREVLSPAFCFRIRVPKGILLSPRGTTLTFEVAVRPAQCYRQLPQVVPATPKELRLAHHLSDPHRYRALQVISDTPTLIWVGYRVIHIFPDASTGAPEPPHSRLLRSVRRPFPPHPEGVALGSLIRADQQSDGTALLVLVVLA